MLCWADLALLGALVGRVGRGFGFARRAGLGQGCDLAVLGGLGWARFSFLCMVYIVQVFFMSS